MNKNGITAGYCGWTNHLHGCTVAVIVKYSNNDDIRKCGIINVYSDKKTIIFDAYYNGPSWSINKTELSLT